MNLFEILDQQKIDQNHPFCGTYNSYYSECSYELPTPVFWAVAGAMLVAVLGIIGYTMTYAHRPSSKETYSSALTLVAAASLIVATGTQFLYWGIPSLWKILWFGFTVGVMLAAGKILTRVSAQRKNLVAAVGVEILLLLGLKMIELNAEKVLPAVMESPLDNLLFLIEIILAFTPLWMNRQKNLDSQNRTGRPRTSTRCAAPAAKRTENIGEQVLLLTASSEPAPGVYRPPEEEESARAPLSTSGRKGAGNAETAPKGGPCQERTPGRFGTPRSASRVDRPSWASSSVSNAPTERKRAGSQSG